jgi:hypothetical protein
MTMQSLKQLPDIVKSMLIVALIIGVAAPIIYFTANNEDGDSASSFSTFVEPNCDCDCRLQCAEIREYDTHHYMYNAYHAVHYKDGSYVTFNRDYVLRVTFNKNLKNGDIIRIYARYGTTPAIKAVLIENTNWEVVGEGEVYAMWGYYDLVITDLDVPRNSFDIALLHTTPSANSIRIDEVKCVCGVPEKHWRDPTTGTVIDNYQFTLYYVVTATDSIDPASVYLDLVIRQTISREADDSTIVETIIEQSLVHVPSIGTEHSYTTHSIPIISRSLVDTDKITISIDVDVTVKGKFKGSDDWIVFSRAFLDVRALTAWWF